MLHLHGEILRENGNWYSIWTKELLKNRQIAILMQNLQLLI